MSQQATTYDRNFVGPQWVIALCSANGERQLSVAVATLAVEMSAKSEGILAFPGPHGNEFFASGIPSEWDGAIALSPERAAILAAEVTGRRVRRAPQLIIPGIGLLPQDAQWAIDLDGPIQIAGEAPTDRVFVGRRLDGQPPLGPSELAVQIPKTAGRLGAAGIVESNTLMSRVTLDPRFPLGWRPRFTSIQRGGIIK